MLKKLNKSNKGFTIIEVLIVLAIAALILLIVFLAVPALQRNSRNTQRKNDAAAVLGAVNDFVTNNNGQMPNTFAYANGTVTVSLSTCGGCSTWQGKVGYYQSGVGGGVGQVQIVNPYAATGPFTTAANDRLAVVIAAGCVTPATGATTGGSARGLAAVYAVENGSNTYAGQCVES